MTPIRGFNRLAVDSLLYIRSSIQTNAPIVAKLALATVFFLSATIVFSLPSPIRPRTSVGLTGVALSVLSVVIISKKPGVIKNFFSRLVPLDFYILAYFVVNGLSLMLADTINQSAYFRILGFATGFYFLIRLTGPGAKTFFSVTKFLSHMAVILSAVSLMQLIFPSVVNRIAADYFSGKEAYGLDIEFNRGRLFPWGATIFIAPFFYVYSAGLLKKSNFKNIAYAATGLVTLTLSLVVSNFRWMFLVYAFTSGMLIHILNKRGFMPEKFLRAFLGLVAMAAIAGLFLANFVFGYNLADRFLLREHHRDVEESVGRITLYDQGIGVFLSRPLSGVGVGNYYDYVDPFQHLRYFSIFDQFELFLVPIASHNEFLTVLAESGIFGLFFFVSIIYTVFKRLIYLIKKSPLRIEFKSLFIIATLVSFTAFVLYSLFENIFPQNYVFLFGLSAILFSWFGEEKKDKFIFV